MCGIAGLVGRLDDANRAVVDRMSAALEHRGPDAAGRWESTADERGYGCLLAHRRLSIIDLSTAADQPMTHPGSGATIVFNGEIYNFQALRSELAAVGEQLTSSGDTEVMLRWLVRHGAASTGALRGMYAFGLWDPAQRSLVLGRDPHGMKPLYVIECTDPDASWRLAFASELRALLASGLLGRPRLDPAAVASYVWNGYVPGPRSIVEGVTSVQPGAVLELDAAGALQLRHVEPLAPGPADGPADPADLTDVLAECVRLHLTSDVPLGVFLSSGIDSAAVANLAHRADLGPVRTFTLAFDDAAMSEGDAAAAIAAAIGTEHHEILLDEGRFVDMLDDAFAAVDQPTFDALNTYAMSRAVREAGLTVALSGTGGDELFGGYQTFRQAPRFHRLATTVPRPVRRVAAAGARVQRKLATRDAVVGPQARWAKLPELLAAGPDVVAFCQLGYALFLPDFQHRLLATGSAHADPDGLPPELRQRLHDEIDDLGVLAAVGAVEQRCFLGERLLRDSDAASMAVSLEYRTPLVDQELTRFVRRLPDAGRFQPIGTKSALRRAGLVGLDPALFDRPKQGFQLPFDRWIRESLGSTMDTAMRNHDLIRDAGLDPDTVTALWDAYLAGRPGLFWSRVWAIYVLVRWCATYGVAA